MNNAKLSANNDKSCVANPYYIVNIYSINYMLILTVFL